MKNLNVCFLLSVWLLCAPMSLSSSTFEMINNIIAVIPEWYQASKALEHRSTKNYISAGLHIINPIVTHYGLSYITHQINSHLKNVQTRERIRFILNFFPTKIACSLLIRLFIIEPNVPRLVKMHNNVLKTLF